MSKEELQLLKQIGKVLVKIQAELARKEEKHNKDGLNPLTGQEDWIKGEAETAISQIREFVKDSELYE